MIQPADLFEFCPRCANPRTVKAGQIPFQCAGCGLTLFFNPTLAACAFISDQQGRLLFIRRAKEPAKGKLAIPGGFVDFGESAEAAVVRETREEVGLELSTFQFLGSWPNQYTYQGVTYSVCDLVFTATAVEPEAALALDAVAEIVWRHPHDVDPEELAFPSVRHGWQRLCLNAVDNSWDLRGT